jgi:C1A family cysteine protease
LDLPGYIDLITEIIMSINLVIKSETLEFIDKNFDNDIHIKEIKQILHKIKDAKEMVTALQQLKSNNPDKGIISDRDAKEIKKRNDANKEEEIRIDNELIKPGKIDSIKEQIKSNTIFIQLTTMQLLGKSLDNDLHTKQINKSLNNIKDAQETVTLLQQLINSPLDNMIPDNMISTNISSPLENISTDTGYSIW